MRQDRAYRTGVAISTVAVTLGMLGLVAPPAWADPGGLVISELNYHAGSDFDTDDFIELANTGGTPIDVTGYTFTEGITATLPAGSIPAGGYYVLSPDATRFTQIYGFAPDATYSGKLSNAGETVTLTDGIGGLVDTVTYSDSAPWPVAADGTGPSLELRDLLSDNTLPENWAASTVTGGTPRAVNSVNGTVAPPTINGVTAAPQRPSPNQPVLVSAWLPKGSAATLSYKVMFGNDVTIPFLDDAASPGGADDGHYAATFPGQAAGQLIRYRVDATKAGVSFSSPAAGDSITYHGVVVTDPSLVTNLPTMDWFMQDSVYNDLLANHRYDDVTGPAVLEYNGTVYDGVQMSIRGNSSRSSAKPHWKVEMPAGYVFDMGTYLSYPLDEFALESYTVPQSDISWNTVGTAGNRRLAMVPVRSQKNGVFWEVSRVMETEDGTWRDAQGVSKWAIYKAAAGGLRTKASAAALQASGDLEKKERKDEDFSDVWNLTQAISKPTSATQKTWLLRNVNVPEIINYLAINTIIRNQDSGWYNWFVARDTEGTGRWELWQWDLNWTFTTPEEDGKGEFLTPESNKNVLSNAILAYPDFKQMYFRRLRTLADQFLPVGKYENMWDSITTPYLSDWALDKAKWGGGSPTSARTRFVRGLTDRRNVIANNTGPGKPVPPSQSTAPKITISKVGYDSATGAEGEYVNLSNPSTTESVDVSGWTISELGLTIPPGTVLLPQGTAVFAANEGVYGAHNDTTSAFIAGHFPGRFASGSDYTLTLRDGSRVVDTATSTPGPPPPTPAPLLSVGVDDGVSTLVAGSSSTYTATVRNTVAGSDPATGVSLTATIPGDAVVLSSGGGTVNGSVITWQVGSVASGTTASRGFVIQAGTTSPQVVTVTATATDASCGPGSSCTASDSDTVTAPPPPPPPPGAKEWVLNPGAETSLDGWSGRYGASPYVSVTRDTTVARSGAASIKVSGLTGAKNLNSGFSDQPRWVTSTVAGTVYTQSVWVKPGYVGQTIKLRLREWRGGTVVTDRQVTLKSTTTGWQQLSQTLTASASGSSLSFAVYGYMSAGRSFNVDDLSLTTQS